MGHGVLLAEFSTDRWLFNKNKKIRHTAKLIRVFLISVIVKMTKS
jgi:hypothetical protein